MQHVESAISLLGLAITLLAWIVRQDRIGYGVKFGLLGAGLMAIGLGVVLLVPGWLHDREKQKAIDQLSEAISQAIHQLVNKPQLTVPTASGDSFADTLAKEYSKWCEGRGPSTRKRSVLHKIGCTSTFSASESSRR